MPPTPGSRRTILNPPTVTTARLTIRLPDEQRYMFEIGTERLITFMI